MQRMATEAVAAVRQCWIYEIFCTENNPWGNFVPFCFCLTLGVDEKRVGSCPPTFFGGHILIYGRAILSFVHFNAFLTFYEAVIAPKGPNFSPKNLHTRVTVLCAGQVNYHVCTTYFVCTQITVLRVKVIYFA